MSGIEKKSLLFSPDLAFAFIEKLKALFDSETRTETSGEKKW